ncbi:hypothetical protein [Streptomyces sp. SP18CS02]|uniref:hypothetical protein n=1 Tax=Streptomyces sp. SP18CS02 TaxID=3002531 RepID=UPI002E760107|nr:hypothetical protein [Streptomyces sp. SP18CS02]MEE1753808.1 hypothetical protein [Streptomyces sp. SP18CS02]
MGRAHPHQEFAVRTPVPADSPELCRMYGRCAPATRYHRFLSSSPAFPPGHLDAVTRPAPGVDALLVTPAGDRSHPVALGSTHPVLPGTVELGVLVEDVWQRRGLGRLLVRRLARRAGLRGAVALTAQAPTGRRWVLWLLRDEVGTLEYGPMSDTVRATARLVPPRRSRGRTDNCAPTRTSRNEFSNSSDSAPQGREALPERRSGKSPESQVRPCGGPLR